MRKFSLLVLMLSFVFTPADGHAQLRLKRRDDLGWHHHAIDHVRFSADAKSLVSAGADNTVRIWDLTTGKVRTVLEPESVQLGSRLEVSPNLQTIIHRAYLHTEKDKREDVLIIWDVATRTREIDKRHAVVGFDLDNQAHLVGRNLSGGFSVIVRGVPKAGKKVTGNKAKVLAAALHPRGQMLAVAGADNLINVWDLKTRRSAATFAGYDASANVRLGFSGDGNKLYADSGGSLKLWRLEKGQWEEDGKEIQLGKNLSFCAISPDGASMIGANWSAEESLTCFSLPDFKIRWSCKEKNVICADFSPDGKTVVTGTQESLINLWDAETGKPLRTLQGSAPFGDRAVFIEGGKTLLAAASERVKSDPPAWIRLVNLADGKTTSLPCTKHIRIAGTSDGKTIAIAHQSGTIDLLERATGKVLRTIDAHQLSKTNYTVTSLHFSPDGLTLASSGMDGTVGLWEVATGKNLATLTGHQGPVSDMTFSHDGKTLASSGAGVLFLWDVAERKRKQTLNGPFKRGPNAIAFSRDDKTVATGDAEGKLILWDVESGKSRREWKGHPHVVWGLSFNPDDKILVSSGNDKEVRMWDTATGKELASFNCRYHQCLSVAFSPDGRTLVTSGNSRGVIVWDVETGK